MTTHVCIGCGRRDTSHPSKLCGKCLMPPANENAQDDRERSYREQIDANQKEAPTHWRCLPGPKEDDDGTASDSRHDRQV